jgi:hypothetical protein
MMPDPNRADPLGLGDLSDFTPRPSAEQTRRVSEQNGFVSREARPQRRRRTGRNMQLNIKATAETISRFMELADQRRVTLGELLEQLLQAHG